MNTEHYIAILTAIVGALGIKEIWKIVKSRVDHSNKLETDRVEFKHEMITQLQGDNKLLQSRLDTQAERLMETEKKITELLVVNKQLKKTIEECALKMARMEERLLARTKKSSASATKRKAGRPPKTKK